MIAFHIYIYKWAVEIVTEKKGYGLGFRSKSQTPFFMIWETYNDKFEPHGGKVIYSTLRL